MSMKQLGGYDFVPLKSPEWKRMELEEKCKQLEAKLESIHESIMYFNFLTSALYDESQKSLFLSRQQCDENQTNMHLGYCNGVKAAKEGLEHFLDCAKS